MFTDMMLIGQRDNFFQREERKRRQRTDEDLDIRIK